MPARTAKKPWTRRQLSTAALGAYTSRASTWLVVRLVAWLHTQHMQLRGTTCSSCACSVLQHPACFFLAKDRSPAYVVQLRDHVSRLSAEISEGGPLLAKNPNCASKSNQYTGWFQHSLAATFYNSPAAFGWATSAPATKPVFECHGS